MFHHIRYAQLTHDGIRMFTLVKTTVFVFAIQKPLIVCFYMYLRGTRNGCLHPQEKWFYYGVCGVYMFYQTVLGYYSYYSYTSYATLKK